MFERCFVHVRDSDHESANALTELSRRYHGRQVRLDDTDFLKNKAGAAGSVRLTCLAHGRYGRTDDGTTLCTHFGGLNVLEFVEKLIRVLGPPESSPVQAIDLLGCGIGFMNEFGESYAQEVANLLSERGYNIKVYAFTNRSLEQPHPFHSLSLHHRMSKPHPDYFSVTGHRTRYHEAAGEFFGKISGYREKELAELNIEIFDIKMKLGELHEIKESLNPNEFQREEKTLSDYGKELIVLRKHIKQDMEHNRNTSYQFETDIIGNAFDILKILDEDKNCYFNPSPPGLLSGLTLQRMLTSVVMDEKKEAKEDPAFFYSDTVHEHEPLQERTLNKLSHLYQRLEAIRATDIVELKTEFRTLALIKRKLSAKLLLETNTNEIEKLKLEQVAIMQWETKLNDLIGKYAADIEKYQDKQGELRHTLSATAETEPRQTEVTERALSAEEIAAREASRELTMLAQRALERAGSTTGMLLRRANADNKLHNKPSNAGNKLPKIGNVSSHPQKDKKPVKKLKEKEPLPILVTQQKKRAPVAGAGAARSKDAIGRRFKT